MSTSQSGGLVALARILFAVETGQMTHELGDAERRFRASTASMERSMLQLSRGVAAGTGAFHNLGRSIAFASAGFIGAAGFTEAVKTSVKAADELHDQLDRVDTIFKTSAETVKAWSQTSNTAMGLAQADALDAAATFGTLLENIGATTSEAAGMSTRLVQLAADMSAFKKGGTTTAEALDALEAAIAGRTRSLKQFGVVVSTATIKQEALRLGLLRSAKDSVASLTDGQRALATYTAIMQQTAAQQGAFATNSGDLSVKLAVFHASVTNLEAALGTALVPALGDAVGAANKWLQSGDNQEKLQRRLKTAVEDVVGALEKLGGVIHDVDQVTGGFGNTLRDLVGAVAVWKAAGLVGSFTAVGGAATGATRNVEGLKLALLALGGPEVLAAVGSFLAILSAKGDQGPGPPSDPHLGQYGGQQFPLLDALGHSNTTFKGAPKLKAEYLAYRRGDITEAQAEAWLRAHVDVLRRLGINVTQADLERSTTLATTTQYPAGTPATGPAAKAAASTAGKSGLRGKGPSGKAPKGAKHDVTSMPWLAYQLSLAQGTAGNADDESVLAQQLRVLRGRLAGAHTLADKTALQGAIDQVQGDLDGLRDQDRQAAADAAAARQSAADSGSQVIRDAVAAENAAKAQRRASTAETARRRAAARSAAGNLPIALQLAYAIAQGTATTTDDVALLRGERSLLTERLRKGTVTFKDAHGRERTADLTDVGRLAIVDQLNQVNNTLKQIQQNTAPLLTIRQRQGFIDSLSGILGDFGSDTSSFAPRPSRRGRGGAPTINLHYHVGEPPKTRAALLEAKEAALHLW